MIKSRLSTDAKSFGPVLKWGSVGRQATGKGGAGMFEQATGHMLMVAHTGECPWCGSKELRELCPEPQGAELAFTPDGIRIQSP